MSYQTWHEYNKLARQGFVDYLRCPDDQSLYIPRINHDDEDTPRLWCPMCGSLVVPGLALIKQVESAVANAR